MKRPAPSPPFTGRSRPRCSGLMVLGCCAGLLASTQAGAQGLCSLPLRVAWHDWPPYHYLHNGKLTGSAIEVLDALSKATGCALDYQDIPWARALEELRLGKVDILMEAIPTRPRQAYARFSRGYSPTHICLWVLKERKAVPKTLDELARKGWRIGTTADFSYGDVIDHWLKSPQGRALAENVRKEEQNLAKLAAGQLDGMFGDWLVVQQTLNRKPQEARYTCARNFPGVADGAFMFSRKSVPTTVFLGFNAALERMAADGRLHAIQRRYDLLPKDAP